MSIRFSRCLSPIWAWCWRQADARSTSSFWVTVAMACARTLALR
ncbi:MAG: hypothetical protein U0694_22165 [Anaerolineae bacterium]